jgi:subtilisin family serine protease
LKLLGLLLLIILAAWPAGAVRAAPRVSPGQRYIAVAKSDADLARLRADVIAAGGTIIREMPQIDALVVTIPGAVGARAAASIASSPAIEGLAKDHVSQLILPDGQSTTKTPHQSRTRVNVAAAATVTPDPAFGIPGLMWDFDRIRATQALQVTAGDPDVRVGVADTGLDFTHSELASRVTQVVDFTVNEEPPLCKTYFGTSDQDLATQTGGPANGDFNGHGSWIGGNIGAALDDQGINGIAPKVSLVALKIAQWCGYAYDSTIMDAFLFAAVHGIDVVSISFGGYLDRSDPDQDTIYRTYQRAVRFARQEGTVIVAAAGNEHVRVGDGGKVLSHGSLTTPGAELADLFGQYEVPGGLTGVVDVSATGNLVNTPSASCPTGTTGANATCKPTSDAHQPTGIRLQNQLAYYSNYGPRIDIAAPGGARKFNLPVWDRGGTPGFPVTSADGPNVWEDFSITSNYAQEIPCYVITGGDFPADQCYTSIQGTSMATPHVSAVLALIASQQSNLRHRPNALVNRLKARAQPIVGNTTRALSATDTSPGDQSGVACPSGYCHQGGPAISDAEAYGAGLVDAFASVRGRAGASGADDDQ